MRRVFHWKCTWACIARSLHFGHVMNLSRSSSSNESTFHGAFFVACDRLIIKVSGRFTFSLDLEVLARVQVTVPTTVSTRSIPTQKRKKRTRHYVQQLNRDPTASRADQTTNFSADLVVRSNRSDASELGMIECARNPLSPFLSHILIYIKCARRHLRIQLCSPSTTTSR